MNILIAPDSYKGTLSAKEVADTIKAVITKCTNHNVTALPFSDGGEGFSPKTCPQKAAALPD